MSMFSLEDKKAVVTGAGRGIGRAIALAYAQQGADVMLASRTETQLQAVAEEVRAQGREAFVAPTDIKDLDQACALVDNAVETFGRIDIWVNNAGGVGGIPGEIGPLIDTTREGWDAIMQLNLKAPFFASQAAARIMRDRDGGAIINVTSIDGLSPAPGEACYGAAKAALQSLTAAMAVELGQYNIRVNAIAPALVDTPLVSDWIQTDEQRQFRASFYPINRIGKPEDIAPAAVYLASEDAGWVSGVTLLIAGGTPATSDLYRWLQSVNPVPKDTG